MQTDAARKLRIDLARWKCFAFRITTDATIGENFTKLLNMDPKRRFTRFYENYTRRGIQHIMILRFARHLRQQDRYAIRVAYETAEATEVMPRLMSYRMALKPSDQFIKLCELEGLFLFRCDCSFSYRRGDKEVYFPLPIQLEKDGLFDEIRGVRFVKLQQDKMLMENSLDLVETDLMVHRVRFAQESKFTMDLPQKLLKQAKDISKST